jgi:hypothetical protein
MNSASSLPKYVQALATSFGVELRPSGMVAMNGFSFSFFPRNRSVLEWVSNKIRRGLANLQASAQRNNGTNRGEPDPVWRKLDSHSLGGVDHGSLRCVVPRQPGSWSNPSCGSDGDEAATILLLLHDRDDHIGGVVDGLDVDAEDEVEVFVCHGVGWLEGKSVDATSLKPLAHLIPVRRTSIVDDDIDLSVLLDG